MTLRIKEEFSRFFTANLLTTYSRKNYLLQAGSYWYFFVNPYSTLVLSDSVKWNNGFRSKWVYYDERDSHELIKDYVSLLYTTSLVFSPLEALRITPLASGVYDLYRNELKSKQTYTFGLSITAQLENVRISGRYRGIPQLPLNDESEVTSRLNNEFGVSLNWDPNK